MGFVMLKTSIARWRGVVSTQERVGDVGWTYPPCGNVELEHHLLLAQSIGVLFLSCWGAGV